MDVLFLDAGTPNLWQDNRLQHPTLAAILVNKKRVILQTYDILAETHVIEQLVDALLDRGAQFKSHESSMEGERILHTIQFSV